MSSRGGRADPAASMHARFPFTPYPRGWFQVAYSADLAPGAVQPLSCFGTELVLFRAESGEAHVLDAHCPHLGAHLGHGGRVVGGTLQCPFHGWRFDGSGACVDIPHARKIPDGAAVGCWQVHEVNGLVLVRFGRDDASVDWRVPALPEYGNDDWLPYQRRYWRIRTHAQEIAENIADPAHFQYVHSMAGMPSASVSAEGHVFRSASRVLQPTPRGPVQGRIDAEAHGLGFWVVRFTGIADVTFITAATPSGPEHLDLRLSFLMRRPPPGGSPNVGQALMAEISRQVEEDIPIWENKIYRARPLYSEGDGPISALRKWSRQFLED